jgi:hypothetical protein
VSHIQRNTPPSEGSGKEYTTGAGLEGGGATAEIKVKAGGITETMLALALLGPEATAFGLRKLGTGALEAAAGNDSRLSNERTPTNSSVTAAKLATAVIEKLVIGGGKAGQALVKKAGSAEGALEYEWKTVESSGGEYELTEAKIATAKGVTLTTEQTITALKKFSTSEVEPTVLRIAGNTLESKHNLFSNLVNYPLALTLSGTNPGLRALNVEGTTTWATNPEGTSTMQLFRNAMTVATTGNRTMSKITSFQASAAMSPAAGSTTTGWHPTALLANSIFSSLSSGTATGEAHGVIVEGTVQKGWTLSTYGGLLFKKPEITGRSAITTVVAFDIEEIKLRKKSTAEEIEEGEAEYKEPLITTALSLRSAGKEVQMRHAGPAKFGANEAPTSGYTLDAAAGDIAVSTVGNTYRVKEGENAKMGKASLTAGKVTVATTAVTANSRIFVTVQKLGTVAVASGYAVTARTAGTSFTVEASVATDTSELAWLIFEPA